MSRLKKILNNSRSESERKHQTIKAISAERRVLKRKVFQQSEQIKMLKKILKEWPDLQEEARTKGVDTARLESLTKRTLQALGLTDRCR
jgi:predicted RNase H-like nuclease (RuvC/YqgF family)